MAYCEKDDLLLGDLVVSKSVDLAKYVQEAADEIDSKLGFLYKLPLGVDAHTADSWESLPYHEVLALKTINQRLASGRVILTLDIAGEQTQLHAYGWYLVKEAQADLMAIANGDVDLSADKIEYAQSGSDLQPSIRQHDEESLLLGYENTVMRPGPRWRSWPGAVT